MKQLLQFVDSGATEVRRVPAPICGPHEVLIANAASLISAGTEKSVIELAKKSLLGKARERPDQVRRVIEKVRQEGVLDTLRQVRARLQQPLALGYSCAGTVIESGREVRRFRPGDRVAAAGPHAEIAVVPHTLVAAVPDAVPLDEACYATVGAVALNALRLAKTGVGDRVAVIGLGLIGQITIQLARASGSRVLATDVNAGRCALAAAAGVEVASLDGFVPLVEHATEGHGADAVLITASASDSAPLLLAATVARKRARLIGVGAFGMDVPRREFYPKELEFVVACSYGPGRYDARYEDAGIDYPYAHARWTAQRNLEAVLEQIARAALDVRRLTTHTFAIERAADAYRLITTSEPHLGVVLKYAPDTREIARRVELRPAGAPRRDGTVGIALVGAGVYGATVLAPALLRVPGVRPRAICSSGGISASVVGERGGFEVATSEYGQVLADAEVDAVVLATPHHLHQEQALAALRAGKHVLVEKPLAVTGVQLGAFEEGLRELGPARPLWMVGFNRRFADATRAVVEHFADFAGPLTLMYRFNAGPLDADHWLHDAETGGGRIIGEACHAFDLAAFLLRGRIVRVFAEAPAPAGRQPGGDDQAMAVLRFDNGSTASINYLSGGNKSFPKERIEVFGGGRVAVIDDFASVVLSADGRTRQRSLGKREKGHQQELSAFVRAVQAGGDAPIPEPCLLNVSRAVLAAVESLQTGLPVDLP